MGLKRLRAWAAACVLLLAAGTVRAVDVRIATMNVCNLKDTKEIPFAAFSNIVKRVQPDILAIQEISSSQEAPFTALLATLPKPLPYRAFMPNPGTGRTTASGDKVAIFSVWPIATADIVKENYHDPDAVEFMRWPIHAKIEVPGALNPLHVVTLHSTATTVGIPERIHRGLEARRVREYVEERILGKDENDVEYVVLGDFNDSAPGRWDAQTEAAAFQPASFTYAQFHKYETNGSFGVGADFILGRDHPWYATNAARASHVMDYRPYPTERFGDVRPVDAFQTGTADKWVTNWKGGDGTGIYRLDYILFSPEIIASSYGAPVAEVYLSSNDSDASPGLRKPGPLPDSSSSTNASDHFLVFSDFHMIDEVGGLTPVAILSEVVHNPASTNANYVEICNTGNGPLDLAGYTLELYPAGSSVAAAPRSLDGIVLAAGAACWLAGDSNEARRVWGAVPDAEWKGIGLADGDDAIVLRNAAGAVHDIYGAIGVDGTGKAWEYTASAASRVPGITEPMSTWHAAEWTIAPAADATPGTHLAVSEANAAITDVSLRAAEGASTAPLASEDFRFSATAIPNVLASNLAMTAHFRVDGGDWRSAAMTNASGNAWLSAATNGAQSAGSSMDYYVSLAFDGPGDWSPVSSAVHSYTFPASASADNLTDVLINEIKSSGTTNEFIELVGAAGMDLSGWRLDCLTKSGSSRWHRIFPDGCSIPDDGATDEFGNHLGFFVAGTAGTPGCDFVITNSTLLVDNTEQNPCMLVLKNAAGAVVDAVALATTNDFVDMKPPRELSTAVARGAANYLHCLGASPTAAAYSLQCPDDVRTGCTDPGKYALPDWSSTNATPGALNKNQTTGALRLARVDTDADGLLDDEDNCPATANTLQSDIDDDGYGDDCDDDMDGDAVPNAIDNCPTEYNPRQEDYDGDGHGNACDPDFDADEWEGRVETFFVDFESGVDKDRWSNSVAFAASGREWVLGPETFIGDLDNDKKIGARSMRSRNSGTLTLVGPLTNGLDAISLFFGRYGTDSGTPAIFVEASTNAGLTWTNCWSIATTNKATTLTPFVVTNLDIPAGAHFRLRTDGGNTASKRVNIDNILLVSKLAVEVGCELAAEVAVEWNGAVHTNEFYVTPSNADWTVTYTADGGTTFTASPSDIGTYTAIVTIQSGVGWEGTSFEFPASLTIAKVHRDPEIVTEEIDATAVSAYLYGTVTPNSDEPLSAVFEWGTTTAFGNKHVADESPVAGYASTNVGYFVENLLPDTLYYWRLRVGDSVGTTRNFTTASLDRPTNTATAVSATSARLAWTPIEGATNYILTVYTSDGGASAEDLTIDFQDWTNAPSSGSWWDYYTSPSVTTQTTASGDWIGYYTTPDRTAKSNGIGSAGTLALESKGSWLRFPPLDGVVSVTVFARSSRSTSTLKLQVSTDGGTTFTDAKTFTPSTTTSSNTCSFAAAQPSNTVFRLYLDANRTIYIHDILVTFAGGTQTLLDGMPANLATTNCLLTNLAASTIYHATVKAQGPGWETEESAAIEFVIPPVPEDLTATNITSTGFDLAWSALPDAEAYDVEVSTDSGFLPPFPFSDIVIGDTSCSVTGLVPGTTYYVRVAESVLTNSVWSDILTVTTGPAQTAEEAFAQWLADRFGTSSNAPAFAPGADADSDGMTTWDEFLADTCPTDATSRLKLELKSLPSSTQAVFHFTPSTSRWYQLVWWTNLLAAPSTNDLGRPDSTNEITIETDIPPEWFGSIRSLLDEPQRE